MTPIDHGRSKLKLKVANVVDALTTEPRLARLFWCDLKDHLELLFVFCLWNGCWKFIPYQLYEHRWTVWI